MIAFFRIRFDTNPDPASVWSDTVLDNWMHIAIPYSLGNFWWESSWGNFDLSYLLFPPIVMADPDPSRNNRTALKDGCFAQVTSQLSPLWEDIDIAFFWFAQRTDMFGGGTYPVKLKDGSTKYVYVTVADLDSPFDAVCQELGHSYGLQHELAVDGSQYGCSYSVMSARKASAEFLRPKDSRLPVGRTIANPQDSMIGQDPQRIICPSLVAAQLFQFLWFKDSPQVIPANYFNTGVVIKLYALDYARERSQSANLPVLAVIPPDQLFFPSFTVELRRTGTLYDKSIGSNFTLKPGLLIHTFGPNNTAIYLGVLPVEPSSHMEWSNGGAFSLRILEVGPNNEFVVFKVFEGYSYPVDIVADRSSIYQLQSTGRILQYNDMADVPGWQGLDDNEDTRMISASHGNLYQLHKTGKIWKYTGPRYSGWQEIDNNVDSVAIVADKGDLYQLHKTGKIWKYTGTPFSGWQMLDNNKATSKIIASGGNLYQLHNTGVIWKYTGTPLSGWQALDNNSQTMDIVADEGNLYQLHKSGSIWQYTGTPFSGWVELDNNPETQKIIAGGGHLYQLHKSKKIWKYTGQPHYGWQLLDQNPSTRVIAASADNLYQLHITGEIWKTSGVPLSAWQLLNGSEIN